jgi:hypothetical protein
MGTLSRLQALASVQQSLKIMCNPRSANSTSNDGPKKRQRGEAGSASGTPQPGPRSIVRDGPQPWNFDLSKVPRRRRTAREEVVGDQPQGDLGEVPPLPVEELEAPPAAVKQEPSNPDANAHVTDVPIYVWKAICCTRHVRLFIVNSSCATCPARSRSGAGI